MRRLPEAIGVCVLCLTLLCCNGAGPSGGAKPDAVIELPGTGGVSFDDLWYSVRLKQIVVAAGERRTVSLIDVETLQAKSISGMQAPESAVEGAGWIFV